MNRTCKKYISNIRTLFPIKGKAEKKYIHDFRLNVYDFCEDNEVSSSDVLYKEFGTPADVVNSYFSTIDTDYVIKKIRFAKVIRIFLISLFIVILSTAISFSVYLWKEYKLLEQQRAVIMETVIE